jgi:hypothetical protein
MVSLARVLLPNPPRRVPHARAWNVASRTLHLSAISVLVGGHAFGIAAGRLEPWLWVAILTGAALVAIEVYPSADWLAQGSGLFVLAKLALLIVILFAWSWRVPILFAVIALAGVGSHMPGRYRHYSLIYRRNMKQK